MFRILLGLVLDRSLPLAPRAENSLKQELEALATTMPATVGVAVIIDGRETVTVNNDRRSPLMSVFKFHQALTGTGAVLGHKTGTSDRDADGRLIALNDAGFVLLPDERHYIIAVFVKDSRANDAGTEAMLADVSACVYRHVAGTRPRQPRGHLRPDTPLHSTVADGAFREGPAIPWNCFFGSRDYSDSRARLHLAAQASPRARGAFAGTRDSHEQTLSRP